MSVLKEHFYDLSKKLKAEYDMTRKIKSRTEKGDSREIFVQDFLLVHLPQNISYTRGEIVDSKEQRSNQQDIIIYKNNAPKICFGKTNIVFAESVVATIEVKSDLNKKEDYWKLLENIKSVKMLKPVYTSSGFKITEHKIISMVFCFNGPSHEKINVWGQEYCKKYQTDLSETGYNMFCVLDKYCIFRSDNRLRLMMDKPGKLWSIFANSQDSLLCFYLYLLEWTWNLDKIQADYIRYL